MSNWENSLHVTAFNHLAIAGVVRPTIVLSVSPPLPYKRSSEFTHKSAVADTHRFTRSFCTGMGLTCDISPRDGSSN